MNIREFRELDRKEVENIFTLYWTDPEFLQELSGELNSSNFFAAEESDEIIGIVGFRELPSYLKHYALTDKPVELYIIASKTRRMGTGAELASFLIEKTKTLGFSEILLYSPHTHDESWNFYAKIGFEKVGEITPPEDEVGQLWRKVL